MTPLRQRMTDDLKLWNYSSNTVDSYVRAVRKFAEFHGRSPKELGPDDQFLLHLVEERRVACHTDSRSTRLFDRSGNESLNSQPFRTILNRAAALLNRV